MDLLSPLLFLIEGKTLIKHSLIVLMQAGNESVVSAARLLTCPVSYITLLPLQISKPRCESVCLTLFCNQIISAQCSLGMSYFCRYKFKNEASLSFWPPHACIVTAKQKWAKSQCVMPGLLYWRNFTYSTFVKPSLVLKQWELLLKCA